MEDVDIFVFGDSITYGVGDNEKCGWVNRVRLNLEENSSKTFSIFNLGISGDITEGVKKRFDFEFNVRFNKENKVIIIFAIGVNDTQDVNGKDRVSINTFQSNMNYLIENAKKYTDKIACIGLSKVDETKVVPLPWNNEKAYFNHKIINFDNKLEEVCKKNAVKYLKVYDLLNLGELDDGIHPNSLGHQKLCDEITKFIKKLI